MWAQAYASKLLYAAAPSTSANGSSVDFSGADAAISKRNIKATLASWGVGGTSPSTVTVTLQESSTSASSGFADITGAAFTAANATDTTSFEEIHYTQTKRYVRAVVTLSANVTACYAVVEAFPLKRFCAS